MDLSKRQLTLAFVIALIVMPISGFTTDLYSPSLPHIAKYFHASRSLTQLTMTTFILGFAVGQIPFGTLSDIIGRRPVLLAGLALYVVSSFLAIASNGIEMLVILRFVQGIASAAPSAIAKSMVNDSFEGVKLKRNLTALSAAWGSGPILGPWIGGYLQHYFNWQAGFYFFGIIGTCIIILTYLLLKETLPKKVPFHFPTLKKYFIFLLSHRAYMSCVMIMGMAYSIIIAFNVVAPFLIQSTLGFNAIVYGHMALIAGVIFFAGTLTNRSLLKYFPPETLVITSICILVMGATLQVVLSYLFTMSLWTIMLPISIIVFNVGVSYPSSLVISMSKLPEAAGISSSISGALNVLTAAIISALALLLPVHSQIAFAWFLLAISLTQLMLTRFI